MCGVLYASLWINKDISTSRSKNGTANATGDYASAIGNNYVNISGFIVENATSNLGWSMGNENNSQKGITLNTKAATANWIQDNGNSGFHSSMGNTYQHNEFISIAYPSPKPPLSGIKNEKFNARVI
ncbi:MAG: hypothetical protein ACNYVW_02890 [Methanosarcinales archaeon]